MFSRLSQLSRHLARTPTSTSFRATTSALSPSPLARTGVIMATAMTTPATPNEKNKRMIHTAGCIIIGDEVLGGKTVDTNSNYFAKYCFGLGINLKRIEVIGDDEGEIVEAVRRMSDHYDLVVTSGGIGPTHDDITYQSIANAFDLKLIEHAETFKRMKALSKPHASQPNFRWDTPSPALEAKKRMVRLPIDPSREESDQVLFVDDKLWVPISVVNGNIHILPGVPRLFVQLLDGLKPLLLPRLTDPEGKGVYRLIFTTPMAESAVATYLGELASRVEPKGVKVGSYPRWDRKHNTVTLVGRDKPLLDSLVGEVEENVKGKLVQKEDDIDSGGEQGNQ